MFGRTEAVVEPSLAMCEEAKEYHSLCLTQWVRMY